MDVENTTPILNRGYAGSCGYSCRLTIYPIIITVWIIAMTTNFLILISSFWLKRNPTINLMFCISLVAADTWASFINIQFLVVSFLTLLNVEIVILNFCFILCLSALLWASSITCVFHLVAIACNHLWGTMFPLKHKLLVTPNAVRAAIIFLWLTPFAIFTLIIGSPPNKGLRLGISTLNLTHTSDNSSNYKVRHVECDFFDYQYFSFRLGQTIPILLAFVSTVSAYVYILALIRSKANHGKLSATLFYEHQNGSIICRTGGRSEPVPDGCRMLHTQRHSNKGIKTTLLITGTFAIGWLPICLSNMLICPFGCPINNQESPNFALIATTSTYILIIIKHMCNALIYALRIPEIRLAMRRMCFYWCNWGTHPLTSPGQTLYLQRRGTGAACYKGRAGSAASSLPLYRGEDKCNLTGTSKA